jgi:hypothetical protein
MITFSTCGPITAAADIALPVASITTMSSGDSFAANASNRSRRMSTRPSRLSLAPSHATALPKTRWMSSPMMRMPAPSFRARLKTGAGGQHDTY